MGATSRSNRPSAQATAALRCDSAPNASSSSRVMPRFFTIRSAPSNWSGMSSCHEGGMKNPGPLATFAPRPTRLIISIPHATPRSMRPAPIRASTRSLACCDEPHWVSTVVAPVS